MTSPRIADAPSAVTTSPTLNLGLMWEHVTIQWRATETTEDADDLHHAEA